MKLYVTVVYPHTFQIDLPENQSDEKYRELILERADYFSETSPVKPIISECSLERLVD